jgi:hypothetical protein
MENDMDKESGLTKTEVCILAVMKMINHVVRASILGKMESNMMGLGKMVCFMARV